MILTGPAIAAAIARGDITFAPFEASALNPNSIDIRLGDSLTEISPDGAERAHAIGRDGFTLEPGALYLAPSLERFGSRTYVPMVHGKSNIARAGLFVHANGEMIDLGVTERYVFQLTPTLPIRLAAGMPIAQVTFWSVASA